MPSRVRCQGQPPSSSRASLLPGFASPLFTDVARSLTHQVEAQTEEIKLAEAELKAESEKLEEEKKRELHHLQQEEEVC